MADKISSSNTEKAFSELRSIVARLRAPNGCPWDREQTPSSVKKIYPGGGL